MLCDLEYPLKADPATRGEDDDRLNYQLFSLVGRQGDPVGPPAPEDFVVCMEDYGVPQARHRIIILGIRSDVKHRPGTLSRLDRVIIDRALADLPKIRSGLSREPDSGEAWCWAVRE